MIKITEQTIIKATPEKIWKFLTSLHEGDNYQRWHPQDHIMFTLIKGDLKSVGSVAYFKEHIGKTTLRGSYQITHSTPPRYLEYSPTFPLSLLRAVKVYFRIEPVDTHKTRFTAYNQYGYNIPLFGVLLDWIVELFIKRKDIAKHIHEEGENLKKILESTTNF